MELIKKANGTVELIVSQPVFRSAPDESPQLDGRSNGIQSGESTRSREAQRLSLNDEEEISSQHVTPVRTRQQSHISHRQITEAEVGIEYITDKSPKPR